MVNTPEDLVHHPDAAREWLEDFAVEGYRMGALSAYQTRQILGMKPVLNSTHFSKSMRSGHTYSVEDLEKDAAGFERQA
jgi:predicted HTH domain antitoxin